MQGFSYNLSQDLKQLPQKIDSLRSQILLTPLTPKIELRLRWEANLDRIYWSMKLENNPLTKKETIKLITRIKKKMTTEEREVVNYRNALDFIKENWSVSTKPISPKTIWDLYNLAIKPTATKKDNFSIKSEKTLKASLDYLQAGSEQPIIQAAVSQVLIENLKPFPEGNSRISRLLSHLFLYKLGYDFRGLLVLEEYWRKDQNTYLSALESVARTNNLTIWLEFFAKSTTIQLSKTIQNIKDLSFRTDLSQRFFNLNDRQREILRLLEQPDVQITNRKVQKLCNVSQITSSRDLSKLASLGLVFPHGKGRSVYYTRA